MSHHLSLVGECSHRIHGASAWRMYALKDENGVFYNGYRCLLCKAEGYGIPRAQDQPGGDDGSRPIPPLSPAGVATTVGEGGPSTPPTPEEWIDHLDIETQGGLMNDSLAPARGIIIGVIISSIFWLLIVAAVIHTSTWTELGRRAVEQGVIR